MRRRVFMVVRLADLGTYVEAGWQYDGQQTSTPCALDHWRVTVWKEEGDSEMFMLTEPPKGRAERRRDARRNRQRASAGRRGAWRHVGGTTEVLAAARTAAVVVFLLVRWVAS